MFNLARIIAVIWLISFRASAVAVEVTFEEASDPGAPVERITFDQEKVEKPLGFKTRGKPKDAKEFAKRMLTISQKYADEDINRQKDLPIIDEFLRLFGLRFYKPKSQIPEAYCAAGVSFAACQAYCELKPDEIDYSENRVATLQTVLPDIRKYYFKPSPAVRLVAEGAVADKKWVTKNAETPKAGWLIVFGFPVKGWDGKTPNHIGIVKEVKGPTIDTVEYNTTPEKGTGSQRNGGTVAYRTRKMDYVQGFVRTH